MSEDHEYEVNMMMKGIKTMMIKYPMLNMKMKIEKQNTIEKKPVHYEGHRGRETNQQY